MKNASSPHISSQYALLPIAVLAFCSIFLSCSSKTEYIRPTSLNNPPPKYAFSSYEKFVAEPVVISEPFRGHPANETAAARVQRNLDNELKPLLRSWNRTGQNSENKTLLIKPVIESIKFIDGTVRFWVGPFAGSSGIHMRLLILDEKSGEIIAHPEFYQHANAMAGNFSGGLTDNAMLNRISNLIVQYMRDNYKNAVGSRTGAE